MTKKNLVYVWSLRNAAADKAGQPVAYKDHERYMKSVLEFLVESLNQTPLGNAYNLVGVIYDDDPQSPRDQQLVSDYGFAYQPGRQWLYPADLSVQGKRVNDLLLSVPSTYRRHPKGSAEHIAGKQDFERRLHDTLVELEADIVVLDGLLVAIAISLLLMLHRLSRPSLSILGRLGDSHDYVKLALYPAARAQPGMLILRLDEPLFFVNAERSLHLARAMLEAHGGQVGKLVLSLEESPDLDGSSVEALRDFAGFARRRGVRLALARLKEPACDVLRLALGDLLLRQDGAPGLVLSELSVAEAVRQLGGEGQEK